MRKKKKRKKCKKCQTNIKRHRRIAIKSIAHLLKPSKKKVLIFLGAGAAIPWGGPKTSEINRIFIEDTYYQAMNGKSIGNYVNDILNEYYGLKESVNFETIISLFERVLHYHIDMRAEGGTNALFTSFTPIIFSLQKMIADLKDYKIEAGREPQRNSEGREMVFLKSPKNNQDLTQEFKDTIDSVYFSKLLSHYLALIVARIGEYDNQSKINEHEELNKALIRFVEYFIQKEYSVRIYTTNYDRLIPKILRKAVVLFDGFTSEEKNGYYDSYPANEKKILSDKYSLVYYNLHGSIYWKYDLASASKGYEVFCSPNQSHESEPYKIYKQGNPGESVILTNIITGYNKLQRISHSPFNTMHHSFGVDCSEADIIFTIGSSFADPHLRQTLGFASKLKNPVWINIDHLENGTFAETPAGHFLIEDQFGKKGITFPKQVNIDDTMVSGDKKKFVFLKGFGDFLLKEGWKEINI
jgi:SIR2-like domain